MYKIREWTTIIDDPMRLPAEQVELVIKRMAKETTLIFISENTEESIKLQEKIKKYREEEGK